MFTAVLVLIIILAVLLILAVLIQNSKGGLSSSMGSASSQLIGVKRTTDLLEKVTWGLAVSIMLLCLVSNFVLDRPDSVIEEEVSAPPAQQPSAAPAGNPAPETK